MHAYVINLGRRPDRRERFLRWNSHKGIDFEFFDAVDGQQLSRRDLVAANLINRENLGFTNGSIGNALSHRKIWETCIESGKNAFVFEDDALINPKLAGKVDALSAALNGRCDIIYLGYNRDVPTTLRYDVHAWTQVSFFKIAMTFEEYVPEYNASDEEVITGLYDAKLVWGTLGYLISPEGATRLLNTCFPLSSEWTIRMYGERRTITASTLDAVVNALIQRGKVQAKCLFPPLVIGPNDRSDSDVIRRPGTAS